MARIHWLQHVVFEGLGSMEQWLLKQGHHLSCTRLWAGDILPSPDTFTGLIVMGGPMSVDDYKAYPWLRQEKEFLHAVVKKKVPVLGICLGAQLLADVLGAEVYANPEKEIGWFPVARTAEIPEPLSSVFPQACSVFHWHGDTFSIPKGGVSFYASDACSNQAFLYENFVLGLQFHLETTPESAAALIEHCRNELVSSPWIQKEEEILKETDIFSANNVIMHQLLDGFFTSKGE